MGSLARILVLVEACPVKGCKAVGIPRKMGRNPVQDHTDPFFVHMVHKRLEIIWCSKTARRRVVACNLVTPGFIQRMFHHRKQLHMGVSHLFHIGCQLLRDLPVVVELAAVDVLTVLILCYRFLHPGTKMDLIDGHRGILQAVFRRCPLFDPLIIVPFVTGHIPDNRCRIRAELRIVSVRIRLQHRKSRLCLDLIFVDRAGLQVRDKDLVDPRRTSLFHLVASSVPEVEIAHNADAHRIRRPHRKVNALDPGFHRRMCPEFLIGIIIDPRTELPHFFLCKRGVELIAVWVNDFLAVPVCVSDTEMVRNQFFSIF